LHARTAPGFFSLRRLVAVAALVAGFAAATAPARADDTTTVGGYTVNTAPPATDSTGSYGTGSSTDSYGTGSYGTGSSTDSYGTGGSGQ
jgi:hypothetical protein